MGRSGDLKAVNDDLIRQLLEDPLYEVRPDGTILTLKTVTGKVSANSVWRKAGRYESNGYVQISYAGKRLLAHRIVYQKFKGGLKCDLVVDHGNGIRDDNRPENLSLVTAKSNHFYVKRRKSNESS
jgi:hypothetical protein